MKKRLTDKDWISAASAPSLQFIQSPVSDSELFFHFTRFLPPEESSVRDALIARTIPALRSKNGRLDAQLVAKLFGLSMTDIAANVEVSRQALTKTPDSLSVQAGLYHFERVASGLKEVTGYDKGLKIWLNAPNKRFDGHTPLEIIKLGQIELLAGWVDDARLGSPDRMHEGPRLTNALQVIARIASKYLHRIYSFFNTYRQLVSVFNRFS